jgi:DNA-binding GntR family transcriptional regulator
MSAAGEARAPRGEAPGPREAAPGPLGEAPAPREGDSAKQLAVASLRAAIMDGDMSPGQRLVEAELAETLAVTRASVRAALIDLSADGLVERIPNRGARVRAVPAEEAVAITECRMVLEGLCAAKAAQNAASADVERLRGIGRRMSEAVRHGEPLAYSALNRELHLLVADVSGQAVAAGLLGRLSAQIVRHQFRLSLRAGRTRVSLPEHLAIIDAIAARDPDAAEAAARDHVRSVIAALAEPTDQDRSG